MRLKGPANMAQMVIKCQKEMDVDSKRITFGWFQVLKENTREELMEGFQYMVLCKGQRKIIRAIIFGL